MTIDAVVHDAKTATADSWPVSLLDAPTVGEAIESWAAHGLLGHGNVLTMVWSAVAELTRTADRDVLNKMAVQCDDASDAVSLDLEAAAVWLNAARALSAAASSVSMASLPMHVRGHSGKSQRVMELVARSGQTMRRSDLASEFEGELSDSHLSHLLRDLEDAGLIARESSGREVQVVILNRGVEALRSVGSAMAIDSAPVDGQQVTAETLIEGPMITPDLGVGGIESGVRVQEAATVELA